jgi:hypothetical protein
MLFLMNFYYKLIEGKKGVFRQSDGYVYETFGISKHFPVNIQQNLIRAETPDKPLTAKCFIYDVCALHEHAAHTCCKLLKKIKNTNLFQWVAKVCKFQRVQVPYTRD